MNKLFSDMKTDEEKSAFFLSGQGYETGVIAAAIQNDVAMAYHRCAEYKKELAVLQAENEKLHCIISDIKDWDCDDVQLDAAKSTAAIAWGWLWHVTTADDRVKTARHLLGQILDKDLKRYGIQTAKAEGAQVNVQEIEAAMLKAREGER